MLGVLFTFQIIEVLFGIQGGHAAGAGRGHCLAVDMVGYVACSKHAGYAGRRGIAFSSALYLEIAVVPFKLAIENRGIGFVSDCDEHAGDIDIPC